MPVWLQIVVGVITGLSLLGGILYKLTSPAIKIVGRVKTLEDLNKKDYQARLRLERLMKAQTKALIAMLNYQISGESTELMKTILRELTDNLIDMEI